MAEDDIDCDGVYLTAESHGDTDPNEIGESDDVIYVDLTKDPESQDWLTEPVQRKKKISERSEEELDHLRDRFSKKLDETESREE
jgi:hypothetical protein